MDFLKYGADAKKALLDNQERQLDQVWRFYLNKGQSARIVFLDGIYDKKLDMLGDLPQYFQHSFIRRTPLKFPTPCLIGTDYDFCPLCENDSNRQAVMAATVIHLDHNTNEGEKKQIRKIFIMSTTILDSLSLGAKKRGGCAGWLIDVTRSKGAKSTYTFDFEKEVSMDDLQNKLSNDVVLDVLDYSTVIKVYSPEEIYKAGLVTPPIGSNNFMEDDASNINDEELKIEW